MSGSSDEMNCGRTKPSEDVKDLSLNSDINTRERHLRDLVTLLTYTRPTNKY